jgi:hypothetical protein
VTPLPYPDPDLDATPDALSLETSMAYIPFEEQSQKIERTFPKDHLRRIYVREDSSDPWIG